MGNAISLESTEEPLRQFQLHVQTELEALPQVLKWFENSTHSLIPEELVWQCQLAFSEGFTNTVCHAHGHLPSTTPIHCLLKIFPQVMEMQIWDSGKAFDLKSELKTRLQNRYTHADPLAEGENGRGLLLMSQLTDQLDYIHIPNQGNCLVMKRKIQF